MCSAVCAISAFAAAAAAAAASGLVRVLRCLSMCGAANFLLLGQPTAVCVYLELKINKFKYNLFIYYNLFVFYCLSLLSVC